MKIWKRSVVSFLSLFMIGGMIMQNPVKAEDAKNSEATIYFNSDKVITDNFEGFGIQWDPSDLFDYTDEQWASFVEKATFLKPNIMRVMLHDADSYCTGFTEDNEPIYDWNSVMMKRVYKILDFAEKENIPIMIGEWVGPKDRGWLTYTELGKTIGWDSPIWADMIVDVIDHLVNVKGYTCIRYYNMINEPNHKKANGTMNYPELYDYWTKGIDNLRKAMDNTNDKKIKDVKIVGPDSYTDWTGWLDQTTKSPTKESIDINEVHWYAPSGDISSGKVEATLKDLKSATEAKDPDVKSEGFGIGEMGVAISGGGGVGDQQLRTRNYDYGVQMFDYAIQCMRAGMKFGSAWGFEDGMHIQAKDVVTTYKDRFGPEAKTEEGKKYQVHTTTGDVKIDNDLKVWGFWNELGEEIAAQNAIQNPGTGGASKILASDEKLRPWYYTWSMICRYFPEGSKVILTSQSELNQVRATSAILPSGDKNDVSMAVVNSSGEDRVVTLSLPNADQKTDLTQYFYYDGEINGKTRPQNEKSQVLPYETLKDCDLSKGVQVTLPAKTAMVLTTLGYNGEKNPISLTTGRLPDVSSLEVISESNTNRVQVGNTLKFNAVIAPEGAKSDVVWSVTDYFGKATDKATIDQNGTLTMKKAGEVRVVATSKENNKVSNNFLVYGTKVGILKDNLTSITDGVGTYTDLMFDDKPSNFGGLTTIKRSDSNASGKPGVIMYEADGITSIQLKAFALKTDLDKTDNLVVEVSEDGTIWDRVNFNITRTNGTWSAYDYVSKDIDGTKNYQKLRMTLKSLNSYKTYEPQYAGCEITYGAQYASNIKINADSGIIAKGSETQFHAVLEPSHIDQSVDWKVVNDKGEPSSIATISHDGKLIAKEKGQATVIATSETQGMSSYLPIDIVGGYFVDDINDFSKIYQYGDFVFEKADAKKFDDSTIIKRVTNTNQSFVYALTDIEKAEFEVYKNGSLDSSSIDIYTSQDGIHYDKIRKTIQDIGKATTGSEFNKFKVSSKTIGQSVNFVRLEVKNDDSIYCPMIGKTEIIYNQNSQNKITHLNMQQNLLSVHVGEDKNLNVKTAPLTADVSHVSWESRDEDIATVDANGKVSGKKVGSTVIYAKYNDQITASCVVNVLNENLALGKETRASSDTNLDAKQPTKAFANDDNLQTRWTSRYGTNVDDYLEIDLGKEQVIDNVKLFWEGARAKDFNIEVSSDGITYTPVKEIRNSDKAILTDDISFTATKTRYVRMHGLVPITKYGYSLWEFEVYNNTELKKVESIEFKDVNDELYVGETCPLNVKINPSDSTYTETIYTSSDNDIIYCQDNRLVALKEGTATITATIDGKSVSQEITVVKDNSRKIAGLIEEIQISDGKLVLPEYPGYIINVYSSDIEKIIDKDGYIHQPVNTTKVNVVLQVQKQQEARSATDSTNTKSIELTIEGNKDSYQKLISLMQTIATVHEKDYTTQSMSHLKAQLQAAYTIFETDNLLVSEVDNAYTHLSQAYSALEKDVIIDNQPEKKLDGDKNSNETDDKETVSTSDTTQVVLFGLVAATSLIALAILLKKKREE